MTQSTGTHEGTVRGPRLITWAEVSPFIIVGSIGIVTALVPFPGLSWKLGLVAALSVLSVVTVTLTLRFARRYSWTAVAGPALFLLTVAAARDYAGGVASAGLAPLVALPLLWVAMVGTRIQLIAFGLLAAAIFWVPGLVIGPPLYPASEWRRGFLWLLVAVIVAPVVQRLVARANAESAAVREANAMLASITRGARLTSIIVTDTQGRIEQFSAGAEAMLGYTADEVIGQRPVIFHDPAEVEAVADGLGMPAGGAVFLTLARQEASARVWTFIRKDGTRRDVRLVLTERTDDSGAVVGIIGVAIDVSEASLAERALRQEQEHTRRLFLDAPHGVTVTDRDGTTLQVNEAFAALVGEREPALLGRRLRDLTHQPDVVDRLVADALERAPTVIHAEWDVPSGAVDRRVAVTARALVEGKTEQDVTILLHLADVSEQRRHEQELAHLADHDELTGLVNRRRFDEELRWHLRRSADAGPRGAVVLIDLDRFKEVNDTLGHDAGDELIVDVGRLLGDVVRDTDVVARLGGDEFAILVTDGDAEVAERVARGVVESIARHAAGLSGVRSRVSGSAGAVTFAAAEHHELDILALADLAMYDAKEAGRNRYSLVSERNPRMPASGARLEWRSRIERALAEDRLVLHVQPILDLGDGVVRSGEALLRMREGDELIPPGRFVPIAERSGMMPQIDAWVLRSSSALVTTLRQHHAQVRLQLNVSGPSIGDPAFESVLEELLAAGDLDAGALVLEITETAAISDVARAREFTTRVRELGCAVALDDFGAGFGTFGYLKELGFDAVKIDGAFVKDAPRSPVDLTIVRSITRLAHELGRTATAEYVTDAAVLDVVRRAGVDQAQGFHIGAPVEPEQFVAEYLDPASPRLSELARMARRTHTHADRDPRRR